MAEPKKKGRPPKLKELNIDNIENAGEEIVKQKRNRPDLANYGAENAKPGDNSRFLRLARASLTLQPIDISDPEQVGKRIGEYFDFCEQNDKKPGVMGLSNWLGVSRDTVNSWRRGEYRTDTHSDLIKKAMQILEELWEDYMQNGKVNPVSGIFLGKITFGYKDVQDYIITPKPPLGSDADPSMIDRYKGALPAATMGDSGDSD